MCLLVTKVCIQCACYGSVPKSLQCVCLLPKCAYNVLAIEVSLKAYNVSACMSPTCLLKDYTMCIQLMWLLITTLFIKWLQCAYNVPVPKSLQCVCLHVTEVSLKRLQWLLGYITKVSRMLPNITMLVNKVSPKSKVYILIWLLSNCNWGNQAQFKQPLSFYSECGK